MDTRIFIVALKFPLNEIFQLQIMYSSKKFSDEKNFSDTQKFQGIIPCPPRSCHNAAGYLFCVYFCVYQLHFNNRFLLATQVNYVCQLLINRLYDNDDLIIGLGRLPGIHRLESSGAWSRQSMLSSSSQLRSARSSLSSRISHYLPAFHGGSARSSITSPFCLPTPLSTRSNSPNNGAVGEVTAVIVDRESVTQHFDIRQNARI